MMNILYHNEDVFSNKKCLWVEDIQWIQFKIKLIE